MAMPLNTFSSQPIVGTFFDPDNRIKTVFEDYEMGGLALQDGSLGLQYQVWHLTYDSDTGSPNYGDFTVTPETTGTPTVLLNVPAVTNVGLSFDQNMFPFVCYEYITGGVEYWWYDGTLPGQRTDALPAGAEKPSCCHDNKSPLQLLTSDVLLFYSQGGSVYIRQERDRYDTPILLRTGTGTVSLDKFGMTTANRVEFDAGADGGVFLSTIVRNICGMCGWNDVNTQSIDSIITRGFFAGKQFTGAEALRSLQNAYFFDMPEIDGELVCVLRGVQPTFTITLDDMIQGQEGFFKTAREQELAFAKKLNMFYQCAETNYTRTKATSERLTNDIKVTSENQIEVQVNFTPEDAAQVVDVMHKVSWAEQAGKAELSVPEKFAFITPADVGQVEVAPNLYKLMRVYEQEIASAKVDLKLVTERTSAYNSDAVGSTPIPPEVPPGNLPGATTWEAMDITPISANHDTLHYYVSGYGDSDAWRGAQIERQVGSVWVPETGTLAAAGTNGESQEVLADHAAGIDVTNTLLVSASDNRLITVTQQEFDNGANYFILDDEIMQYRDSTPEGNFYRLSYLNRGALNTDPVAHGLAERFVYFNAMYRVIVEPAQLDTTMQLRAASYGTDSSTAVPIAFPFVGRSQIEWQPLSFAGVINGGDDWVFTWLPNPRLGSPLGPIQSINLEGYRLKLTSGATTVEVDVGANTLTLIYTDAEQIAAFGGLVLSWDNAEIMGLNRFTGEGQITTL